MKIIITEEQKKKLFIPRNLDKRYSDWNKNQPILTIDGVHKRINQYDSEGRKQGYWVVYEFDEISTKGNYVNGKMEGIWEFYDNGELWRKGSYKNDEQDGIWGFYDNGELWKKGSYLNGLMDGVWEWYNDDETISVRLLFKDGKKIKNLPLTEGYQIKEGRVKASDRIKVYENNNNRRTEEKIIYS